MKIIVTGSSFASTVCILNLVKNGFKPILIDSDIDIKISKIELQKDNKSKILNPIQSIGGLSNFWSGSVDEYSDKDLVDWPISYDDLKVHYKNIFNNFNFKKYNNKEFLLKNFENSNVNFASNIIKENKDYQLKFADTLVKKSSESEIKFDKLTPYSFRNKIIELLENKKIDLIKGSLLKFLEKKDKITIKYIQNNEIKKLEVDFLFLGSGAISTYKILFNSINFDTNMITLKTQQKLLTPIIFNKYKIKRHHFYFSHPLFQINLNRNKQSIYGQIYNFNINIFKHMFPKIKKYEFTKFFYFIFKKFGFVYFTFGSDLCDQFSIKNNKILLRENKTNVINILKEFKYLYNFDFSYEVFKLLKLNLKRNSLSGNHFGASFPMSNLKNNFTTSINGRLNGIKRVSIIDSSIFSSLNAKPPTLTIMANSSRISENIIFKIKNSIL